MTRDNDRVTREFEDEGIIIYKRAKNYSESMKMYFVFDKKLNQHLGQEFKTRSQVVSYLKQGHRI